ncbi:type VI secretion system ATPase TssH [Litoribrevibacter euphylliae]|uniref:Type VI secretion system ATPase TssH n=1 Tax=Litoribrevibacter euphylliae TaxID=1834034 RepID=A0ABV7HI02_9GAMM
MTTVTLKSLVNRLNPQCRNALEAATALCQSRSHFTVEIDHWLSAMLDQDMGDIKIICGFFGINPDELNSEIQTALEKQKSGNNSLPSISIQLTSLLKQAWLDTSIQFGDNQIRSAYILYTLLNDETLSVWVARSSKQLSRIDAEQLLQAWPNLQKDSQEASSASVESTPSINSGSAALDQFTIDLTEQARAGKIDPILGRDNEIRQMADILTRRRQNNPILTGEAGVGKTAVVEGLALRIAQSDVPEKLKNVSIRVLDLALLQAGAGMKGEFENRLKQVIKEVSNSPVPIILFIDEAHTMIGSGGQAGQNDAANLLKPALARGELRTIAATTWAEYKKYFEKDAALTRRFQVVKVEEPSPEKAVVMMRGLLPVMEQHHTVSISDQALHAAVTLSDRYINGRQLPDKAVGLLDTACARVAMSQDATPAQVENKQRRQAQITSEIEVLQREQKIGEDHSDSLDLLQQELTAVESELETLKQRWEDEKSLVEEAQSIVSEISSDAELAVEVVDDKKARLKEIRDTLSNQTDPMVHWQVTDTLVAEVVSDWTGIPLGRMQADEIETILSLQSHLEERVIGQKHALELISKTVQTSRAHLSDENRPNGIFLLTGPSGVGKTETALALAEQVYGSEDNVTVINMSEFKEEHKVSLLLGSPPGYVGYGEGGVLTEAVRRKPYSVVLLDEMEKAHPGVQDIFYQVFDKGMIKDGEGRDIDFCNTTIIMTSNVGTDTTMRLCEDPETAPSPVGLGKALKDDLLAVFKPAFLGRLNVIPYLPLNEEELSSIAKLQLNKVVKRLKNNYQANFTYDETVVCSIVEQCTDVDSGARVIHNILQNQILPELSLKILGRMADKTPLTSVQLAVEEGKFVVELT